jgi:hypothetical protein
MNSAQPFDMAPAPLARAISNGADRLPDHRLADRLFYVFEMSPCRAFGFLPPKGGHVAFRRLGDKTP